MTDETTIPRSGELMSTGDTALLVIDVQEKLIGAIADHQRIVWNISRLIDGAQLLGVPVLATEQYPRGLGHTVAELAQRLEAIPDKVMFSCRECAEPILALRDRGVRRILLTGIETHVCIAQSALDLMAAGFRVYLPVDALGARGLLDHQTALGRLDSAGATLTSTEAALFEWCEQAGTPEFKKISELVKASLPRPDAKP